MADYFDPAFPTDSPSNAPETGDAQEGAEKALTLARKLVPLFIALAVIALAFIAYSVLPRDSNVHVSLTELDSGNGLVANVEVQANGRTVRTATTGADGSITIPRVPGNTDLTVRITPVLGTYDSFTRSIRVDNGGTADLTEVVPRNLNVELGDVTPPLATVGQGCAGSYTVSATNKATTPAKVTLVFDTSSPAAPSIQGDAVDVAPGATETVPFTFSLPRSDAVRVGSRVDGVLRPQYQLNGRKVSFTVADTPNLDASPSSFRCPDAGACKFTVSIHNRGLSPLSNIRAESQGEIAPNVQIDDAVSTPDGKTLAPDETYSFFVKINPDPSGATGQLGKLVLSSSCPPNREIILYGPGSTN